MASCPWYSPLDVYTLHCMHTFQPPSLQLLPVCRVDVVSREINTDPNHQLHGFSYSKTQPWVSMKVARSASL